MAEIQAFGIALCIKNNSDLFSNCKLRGASVCCLEVMVQKVQGTVAFKCHSELDVTAEAMSKSGSTEVKTKDKFYWLEWIYLFPMCKTYLLCSQAHKLVSWQVIKYITVHLIFLLSFHLLSLQSAVSSLSTVCIYLGEKNKLLLKKIKMLFLILSHQSS